MIYRTLLFDLDGTLTDSMPGITETICLVLDELHQPHPPAEQLAWCVGPPLIDSFKTLLGPQRQSLADQAMELYEKFYPQGAMFHSQLYPHVTEELQRLLDDGRRLAVVTGKPVWQATPIIEHFGLLRFFSGIYGPLPQDRSESKAHRLALALADLHEVPEHCLYFGDRQGDVDGAKANRIATIAVAYGYGEPAEHVDAAAVASSPTQWLPLVKRLEAQPATAGHMA